jgi:hypothetical protein
VPLWWTLRRRDHGDGLRRQPMNYEALRAVFRRVNALLGTNYSMHDLRHYADGRVMCPAGPRCLVTNGFDVSLSA